jgi:predicted nucleotidyltransferase
MEIPEASIEKLRSLARADSRILGLYLFGSQLHGDCHEQSDVDLGVLPATELPLEQLVELERHFEEALDTSVDLVDLSRCNAYLALEAIRGERLYASDSDDCDEFDLYVMRRAGDLAPFERERRRHLLEGRS